LSKIGGTPNISDSRRNFDFIEIEEEIVGKELSLIDNKILGNILRKNM
jgi:hypothetical protein